MRKRVRAAQTRRHREFETILSIRTKRKKTKHIEIKRKNTIMGGTEGETGPADGLNKPNFDNDNEEPINLISAVGIKNHIGKGDPIKSGHDEEIVEDDNDFYSNKSGGEHNNNNKTENEGLNANNHHL
jgi:hypothetical protein